MPTVSTSLPVVCAVWPLPQPVFTNVLPKVIHNREVTAGDRPRGPASGKAPEDISRFSFKLSTDKPVSLSPDQADTSATMPRKCYVRVALDVPIPALYDYCSAQVVEVGQRVIVPFGRREMVGMVVERPAAPAIEATQLRAVSQVLDDLPPMPDDWLRLMEFAARYYQRPLGEVIMPALPAP